MLKDNILYEWISWHLIDVPKFLISVWKNYIVFALNYFSLPVLIKSLFSPWRKYRWKYPKIIDVGEFASAFISNVFSRFIGALVRLVLIIVGAIFQIFVILVGLVAILTWIILIPLVIAGILFVIFY